MGDIIADDMIDLEMNAPDFGEMDDIDPTMLAQIELEAKIETFKLIDEDIKNGIEPF